MKSARYDKLIEAFGGTGHHVTDPQGLTKALHRCLASGKPAMINCVIDPTAGTKSGHLQSLNPQSQIGRTQTENKKNHDLILKIHLRSPEAARSCRHNGDPTLHGFWRGPPALECSHDVGARVIKIERPSVGRRHSAERALPWAMDLLEIVSFFANLGKEEQSR